MTRHHQPAETAKQQSRLPLGRPGDRFEQEADRVADAVVRGERAGTAQAGTRGATVQRAGGHAPSGAWVASDRVAGVLQSSGQPLDADTRSMMENRLGFDFSRVRVHADREAAASAAGLHARAYTVGADVVFGAGQYAPQSVQGRRLIAHELTHVRQQAAAAPMLQRWNFLDEIAGWFAGDDFDNGTLTRYLTFLAAGKIEDHSDSDNKARAIVKAWKKDPTSFNLTPPIKALLILEMQSGATLIDDERAILDLLTTASDSELTQFFTTLGLSAKELNGDLDGASNDQLMAFFARRFVGGYEALKRNDVTIKAAGAQAGPKSMPAPDKPRKDFVFIMGEDSARAKRVNPFYTEAEKFFRVHYPKAEMNTSLRTLDALLSHIDRNIADPIGNLFVVSHGNQDGTLSFGFDADDMVRDPAHPKSLHGDSRLSPMEVREALHPAGGGKSTLVNVAGKIDEKTTIHIRGCDLGQNKEFVNLIDEAFGGKGVVIASTHEQDYGTDPTLADRARAKAKKDIEDGEPMPPPVDPAIKEPAKKRAAIAARAQAVKDRQARINKTLKDKAGDIDDAAALAQAYESASGVVMQRPGATKFTLADVKAEIDRRYGHLTKPQRANFTQRVFGGQQVQTERNERFRSNVPATSAQALAVFTPMLRQSSFVPDPKRTVQIATKTEKDGTETKTYTFFDKNGSSVPITVDKIPANDAQLIRESQTDFPNPQSYDWAVTRTQRGPQLTITVVATRVFADLHHQSLNVTPHDHFSPPESDPQFYVKSTFEPEDPAKKKDKK